MKCAAISIALALSSLTLAAQNSPEVQTQTLVVPMNVIAGTCPIGMRASQGVWDHTIRIRQGEHEQAYGSTGQKISLTLRDTHPARIQAATVRVRGLTGKNHMLQTANGTSENWDAVKTIRVAFAAQADGTVSGDLWIPGFTSVSSVELQEVSYADGSTWRISGNAVCRVVPDPLMLISNR